VNRRIRDFPPKGTKKEKGGASFWSEKEVDSKSLNIASKEKKTRSKLLGGKILYSHQAGEDCQSRGDTWRSGRGKIQGEWFITVRRAAPDLGKREKGKESIKTGRTWTD